MSRCFPFTPPGYQKKASNDHYLEIAKKEKHKENRHKKDEKGKEKGEHKRRKDEYGGTEKHKKKKDWKERQKEKYRKTSRDHNNREAVDGNKERKVSDEKIIKNHKGLEEQKSGESTMLVDAIKTSTFAEGFDRNIQENSTKRMLFQNLVPDEKRNGTISREFDSVSRSFNLGKETRNEESDIRKQRSQSVAGDMVEKTTSFKSSCNAGGSLEKDGKKNKEENNSNKRTADQMSDGQIQEKVKDGSREKSKKRKDRIKDKEKKKEKHKMRREKFNHKNKEHRYIKDSRKEQDISHGKSLISLTNPKNGAESDGSLKRKEPDNLFSLDYDIQPNKLSRAATPLLDERNRSRSNFSSPVPPHTPNLNGTTSPIEKILLRDCHTNGTKESIVSSVTYAHPSADESDACEVSTTPAHTDSQYLRQIYSVPEMEELSDTDDQEWLFRNDMLGLKPDSKFKSDEMTLTWERVVWYETSDVIALPYVIPY